MRDKVEAILFAAGRYVDEDQIKVLLQEDVRKIRKALNELQEHYEKLGDQTSLQVVQEEKSWKLHVKDKYLDIVSKLVSDKEIAKTVLETLAIVAWKNPVMQAELIKIRGPAAYEHVAELLQREFITKEPLGRTFQLKVTQKFFDYFDVEGRQNIKELFKAVEEKAAEAQAKVDSEAQAIEQANAAARAESPELENSQPTDSAHSAKDNEGPEELFDEVEEAVDELAKDKEL